MMTIPEGFKPQLAIEQTKVKTQPTGRFMSEKLDGIRCIIFGGVAYSRSLKPIPNKSIQAYVKHHWEMLDGMDGELIVGDKNAPDVFNQSTSGVMRQSGEPEFTFWVFDRWHPTQSWLERYARLVDLNTKDALPLRVELLQHFPVTEDACIDDFEAEMLAQGAEGVMVRDADAKYKCGRSGTKNPELQKVKRFSDITLKCIGYEPMYKNQNAVEINELGRTSRSSSKEGLFPQELLGALLLVQEDGNIVNCGSGFKMQEREYWWERKEELIGKFVEVKYFAVGVKDALRFPIFKGFRDERDIS
jgi:DNA ligase-1